VDSENTVKIFLPKCYTEVFRDGDIENINDGTKFNIWFTEEENLVGIVPTF